MIPVTGDHLVALLHRHLHADDDRFLADVEVAEAADEAHARTSGRLLLETPDQQHLAIGEQFLLFGEGRYAGRSRLCPGGRFLAAIDFLRNARAGLSSSAPQGQSKAEKVLCCTATRCKCLILLE